MCRGAAAGWRGCCLACWREAIDPAADAHRVWLGAYEGPLGDAITAVKYQQGSQLARALGTALGREVAHRGWRMAHVTSVPLHRSRLKERGYDQAERLARAVAGELGRPYRASLKRVRATRSQVGLDRDERCTNVQGAFRATAPLRYPVLLVDDVLTTGATTDACIAQLTTAGCPRVYVAVVARAGW
jgi:ComF family protein